MSMVVISPDQMGRIIGQATDEILGQNEGKKVLSFACLSESHDQQPANVQHVEFPFDKISQLETALEHEYGTLAGRGVALRIGRACLKYILREYGIALGLTGLNFRLLPLPSRLKVGNETLSVLFSRFTDQPVRLEENDKQITWHIEHCPLCRERKANDPCCTLIVGLIQETLSWLSAGKFFPVQETSCIACGARECTIVIERLPIP
jgi:predicted hydrocarbon binding protein